MLLGCGSSDSGDAAAKPVTAVQPTVPTTVVLGDEVTIDEVAVYQAVKVTVVSEGALVPALKTNAPVIANRPAFVRVFVKAHGRARPVVDGELRVKRNGKP